MFWKNATRFMIFWSFVLLAAYLVYIYPLHRLTTWLGYPTLLNVPAIVGFGLPSLQSYGSPSEAPAVRWKSFSTTGWVSDLYSLRLACSMKYYDSVSL